MLYLCYNGFIRLKRSVDHLEYQGMENVMLIANQFKTDISALDLTQVINPKEWENLSSDPTFTALDGQIIDWLKQNTPTTYEIACATSGRKSHDQILINAIKAKILFEQLEYVGLRSMQNTRFFNLFVPVFENTYKYVVKAAKKHDVKSEYVEFQRTSNRYNISPDDLANSFGFSKSTEQKINVLLEKQPESAYLQLCKNISDEAKLLDGLRRSIEEISFEPKDRSEYQTCACCFRWVRLQPSDRTRIAYHGYKLSAYDYNDVVGQSCKGAGSIALLHRLRKQSAFLQTQAAHETYKNVEYQIKAVQQEMEYVISRIEATHPDRLTEACSI